MCIRIYIFNFKTKQKKKQIIIKKIKRHKIKETKENICGKSNGI